MRGGAVVITWVCGANPYFISKGSFPTEDAEKAASALFFLHCIYLDSP